MNSTHEAPALCLAESLLAEVCTEARCLERAGRCRGYCDEAVLGRIRPYFIIIKDQGTTARFAHVGAANIAVSRSR